MLFYWRIQCCERYRRHTGNNQRFKFLTVCAVNNIKTDCIGMRMNSDLNQQEGKEGREETFLCLGVQHLIKTFLFATF